MSDDLVKVAVRIRPLVQSETDKGCQICLNVIPGEQQIQIQSTDKAFTFNYVFPPECGQEEFYNTGVKHLIKNIFEGYNVTILAYGQTGSGKTFSMGTNYAENSQDNGVIPHAVNDIFEIIQNSPEFEYKVSVAFMELYKEQLFDLLAKKARCDNLVDIREDTKGLKFFNLSEVPVANTQETLKCLADGSQNRATGSTAMNVQSSRSHAIFTITVHQQKKGESNSGKFAKFHLVDLAGSERSKKTQATGERFKEGVNINKGLLALGNVISQLGEGGNSSYIGYRDSKLTRLLQDSLGGNSVTLMIACVSPADYNLEETVSTLRYADRAKKIKNKPIVNQDPRDAQIENLKRTIRELKSSKNDINFCPSEHAELSEQNNFLQKKVRNLTDQLNTNLIKILHLHEQVDLNEQASEQTNASIAKILEDCEKLLEEFNKDPFDKECCKTKLETICFLITSLQKDQKKAVDELVNHQLSIESFCNSSMTSVANHELSSSMADSSMNNDTYYLDEKHEEHTLQQVERVDKVQFISKQIANKEDLVSNLLRNSPQIAEYHKEVEEMEKEIKNLQKEKDDLIQALRNAEANAASSKLAETRRKKVQELEKKISELSRKCLEQNKIIKNKEKSDLQVKALERDIMSLKQTKVKLIRDMRSEADKFSKWKKTKEQELYKLRDQDRKHLNQLTKLKLQHSKQTNVMKRKIEEYQATNKRLKDALDLQKKALQRKEKSFKDKDDVKSWVSQELEVLLSSIDAECTLNKLKQDKALFTGQLAELQLKDESDKETESQIAEIVDYLDLRNKQIEDLEQHIKEFNKENRSKTRWNLISTMVDAKEALKTLFEISTLNGKKYSLLKSEYNDLMEKTEKLKDQQELLQQEMKPTIIKDEPMESFKTESQLFTELNGKIQSLQEEVQFYKNQCEEQQKILSDKDCNVIDKKPKPKLKPKPIIEESMCEESFLMTDDSIIEDDDENDPDWKKTPLFTRIKVMEKQGKNAAEKSKLAVKRTSNGDVKCRCKTQCMSRLCGCRKNGTTCEDCHCDSKTCQNRDGNDTRRTLFFDSKIDTTSETSIKKSK